MPADFDMMACMTALPPSVQNHVRGRAGRQGRTPATRVGPRRSRHPSGRCNHPGPLATQP
eukprot:1483944-Rhodomonas_salina.3